MKIIPGCRLGAAVGAFGVAVVVCCSGDPFSATELEHVAGAGLGGAGADAGAASIGAGGAHELGGAGVASGGVPGNEAGNGGASTVDPTAGAGGELGGTLCDRSSWQGSAFATWEGDAPPNALDGSTATRWASGIVQTPGQWFAVELGEPLTLEQLTLESLGDDYPRGLQLELDGMPTPATMELSDDGGHVGGARVVTLRFEPTVASSVRLELTAAAANWWTILELGGRCR